MLLKFVSAVQFAWQWDDYCMHDVGMYRVTSQMPSDDPFCSFSQAYPPSAHRPSRGSFIWEHTCLQLFFFTISFLLSTLLFCARSFCKPWGWDTGKPPIVIPQNESEYQPYELQCNAWKPWTLWENRVHLHWIMWSVSWNGNGDPEWGRGQALHYKPSMAQCQRGCGHL